MGTRKKTERGKASVTVKDPQGCANCKDTGVSRTIEGEMPCHACGVFAEKCKAAEAQFNPAFGGDPCADILLAFRIEGGYVNLVSREGENIPLFPADRLDENNLNSSLRTAVATLMQDW